LRVSSVPLSILDLAIVGAGETVAQGLEACVRTAQRAEAVGYERVWYAEHHNMDAIASSATAVLIAHIAANTERIRLGSGGVMLPNHSPLTIAEQFGTLATLHPGRIDLGLGRAPGTDQRTLQALRRDPSAAEMFPRDVLELQGYLSDETLIPGVNATPGRGTKVPLYILGSSLFGAELAALLGLPFGFAAHFAPGQLREAVALYRERFQPSEQIDRPWVIAGVNVIAAQTDDVAQEELLITRRARLRRFMLKPDVSIPDSEVDRILASPQGSQIERMMEHTAVGTPDAVRDQLDRFAVFADADELMVCHQAPTIEGRLRSLELTAQSAGLDASSPVSSA
jgi:luciferase family oxidoreductase group 1